MNADDDRNRQALMNALVDADRDSANAMLDDWAASRSYRAAILEILEPVLLEIGERWAHGELTLAHGYVASKIAEDILIKAVASGEYDTEVEKARGPVILGNIEDDFHALGRKMVGTFLQAAGWQVVDLGNDVTAKEFIDKAEEVDARIIGASAMMYTTAANIKKLRDEIDRRGHTGRIQLAVGGAIFKLRRELVNEVGGDGTTDSAINAPKLFDELWQKSLQWEASHE